MKKQINVFGKLTDIVENEVEINFPLTVVELKNRLTEVYPKLKDFKYKIIINQNFVYDDNDCIESSDDISLMPPFSGG
ncbi:MAG: MoaD/ThiS family protein [Flavobacteriales bacterium]|nr:MoaD/ThiS family protein [Flavobacteriales bacterium]